MSYKQATYDRIEKLTLKLKQEIQGFLLAPYIKEPEVGFVDITLFGIRFKLLPSPDPDEKPYKVIELMHERALDPERIFLELVSRGYLVWLRQKTKNSHFYYTILEHKDRWRTILEVARKKAREQKQGEFRISYIEHLLTQPFQQTFHQDPTIWDWIIA
jgi:hypothetical protein